MAEEERILEVTPDFDGKRIDQCPVSYTHLTLPTT